MRLRALTVRVQPLLLLARQIRKARIISTQHIGLDAFVNQSHDSVHSAGINVGSRSQAGHLTRNSAMDDSIGGSYGVTGLRVQ